MPSEQPQIRPALGGHRSTGSLHSQTDSPSTTPPQHAKHKTQKHVVGGARTHARVPSNKGLHKLTKVHGNEGSHTDLKKLGKNASTTSLKKNNSHVSLKRNRSSADVQKKGKTVHDQIKRPASVHFEIGEQEDAWEEASSSASPALSRSASRQSSAKHSANNSQPHSPSQSPVLKSRTVPTEAASDKPVARHSTADAKVITERLLQRTPSHNTTKMSLATATPSGISPDPTGKSQGSMANGTPKIGSKEDVVSRFVGGSGTPKEKSPFLHNRTTSEPPKVDVEDMKRAQSMGNLTRQDFERDDDESLLAPRARKSSTTHAYIPPQQSRTQQKLWLQRASSNIEPQQMTPGVAMNGLSGLHGGSSLTGTGIDRRDPRIKQQLERTGLEYLVVRRHQDPVGQALKRLSQLPGANKHRRIPSQNLKKSDSTAGTRHGLSESLTNNNPRRKDRAPTANSGRSSFESQPGSQDDGTTRERGNEDDSVSAILRSLWEKNYELSASAD